ncbi:MAG: acyl-CoA dehydrogenase family protein, partial [Pseudomonadota bacterium]|nr:acyl-CoA dehydrogenase family protein [Pseudomonadota bacterium]
MHFQLNDEQLFIQEAAKKFAENELKPIAAALEKPENRGLYLEQLKTLSSLGFMGLNVKSDFGGSEVGVIAFSVALTEVAKACASTGVAMSVNNLVGEVIQIIGSEKQKETYIPRICSGEYTCGAFCLSESEAGSDPSRLKTRAVETDQGWELNGSKMWISNAEYAGLFVVWAVSDPEAKPGKGISCFIVEGDNPGISVEPGEKKMGQRASSTNTVHFTNCMIPKSALLGEINQGFKIAVG